MDESWINIPRGFFKFIPWESWAYKIEKEEEKVENSHRLVRRSLSVMAFGTRCEILKKCMSSMT